MPCVGLCGAGRLAPWPVPVGAMGGSAAGRVGWAQLSPCAVAGAASGLWGHAALWVGRVRARCVSLGQGAGTSRATLGNRRVDRGALLGRAAMGGLAQLGPGGYALVSGSAQSCVASRGVTAYYSHTLSTTGNTLRSRHGMA